MSTVDITSADAGVGTDILTPLGTPEDPSGATTTWGVINRRPVNQALQHLLAYGTGRPVGINRAPITGNDANATPEVPYAILYPIPGGSVTGAELGQPETEAKLEYQVRSIAVDDEQVEWMADHVRQTILGRDLTGHFIVPLTVAGMAVLKRELSGPIGGQQRQDNIYSVDERYYIYVSVWS